MRRYDKYKNSGVDWLGDVPSHWKIVRNRFLFKKFNERTETGNEPLLSLTKSRGLILQSEATTKEASANTLVGYKICKVGQIVMNKLQAWNGMFDKVRVSGLVSPDYTVIEPITKLNLGV